ncbi:sterile alpha motif domain-containing protein 13 isoform X2 [Corvus kubaryi]|uniref:sterile alpha motif domain-containing protein 13 isoform X2 n=1 Tax=Corvus kubaryi TaxID=68294 RepID=UPI0005350674|nr:sterile alpha motif domain-containing protein 13 isoform X2 [Corvus kubaryi]
MTEGLLSSLDTQLYIAVAEVKLLPMLTVDMENKENGSLDVKNSVENGRPLDPADWAVTDVVNYFRTAGFEEQANAFQEQEVSMSMLRSLYPRTKGRYVILIFEPDMFLILLIKIPKK